MSAVRPPPLPPRAVLKPIPTAYVQRLAKQGRLEKWFAGKPLWMLALFLSAMPFLMFGVGVVDWWVAHQLSWWVFGIVTVASFVFRVLFKMWREK